MPGLGDTVLGLARLKKKRDELAANLAEPFRLKLVAATGANPGELRMLTYVPSGLPEGAPLVVVLHGCTQNAAAYDHGAGWSALAERHGFAVLFPEQQRSNNANLCFNWFQPDDIAAAGGEAASIRAMTLQMVATHRLDPRRVFVTGLSAGGGMTAAMLATAPDVFAGGAVIAGLPYGAASSVMEAFSAMSHPRTRSAHEWGDLVRHANTHRGPWPAVQVWHGDQDGTVAPANADALIAQWTDVLALPPQPDLTETVDQARHQVWLRDGHPVLESWRVPGLGHGTPILADGDDTDRAAGIPGPHMLASSIPSTWHLARRWGLLTQPARTRTPVVKAVLEALPAGPGAIIEKALKAAGLR